VILSAINGYLLLGLAASAAVAAIALYTPEAYSFSAGSGLAVADTQLSDHIYYGFVTLTTVGYGDIVPHAPLAKSLAILIGVTGQLYVAINIAMLVGKFSSAKD
jgi:voltage-gated potassium channel Kch